MRRCLLRSREAGQGFLLCRQMQGEQSFQRKQRAPERWRHFREAPRCFRKRQQGGKPIRQPFDFGMHAQQYP